MSRLWEAPMFIKIHQHCGGRVRWVEAINSPGTGYTGQCELCQKREIPTEGIIPIEVKGDAAGFHGRFDIRSEVLQCDPEAFAELGWNDDEPFDKNQERIRRSLLGEEVAP